METPVVRTRYGLLKGASTTDGAVCAFKGVPYAKPPTGDLRWRPPQSPEPWGGVRDATKFGPRCLQHSRAENSIAYYGVESEGEDCLYLNIWTGAAGGDERRPVMVWVHGGAFYLGSGALPIFDGEFLARKGAVVVTLNYRLGRLGFLAHPELSAESSKRVSGNYGLLDIIAVLRWVRENISAFGGDPDCVTLQGQSVGSQAVNALVASPLTRGLVHRAIGQSGGMMGPPGLPIGGSALYLDRAERSGMEFARRLGASSIDELRSIQAETIQLMRPEAGWIVKKTLDPSEPGPVERDTGWAVLDGHVIPEPIHDVFARGGQHPIPLLTGSNGAEGALFAGAPTVQAFVERARAEHGEMASEFLMHYAPQSDAEAADASRRARGEQSFNSQNWMWARMHTRTSSAGTYLYHFNRTPPEPEIRGLGAFHCAEIPYVFGNFVPARWAWQGRDCQVRDAMSSYFVNFARTGNPNGEGAVWPRFDPDNDVCMHFSNEISVGPVPHRKRLAFWDRYREKTWLRAG